MCRRSAIWLVGLCRILAPAGKLSLRTLSRDINFLSFEKETSQPTLFAAELTDTLVVNKCSHWRCRKAIQEPSVPLAIGKKKIESTMVSYVNFFIQAKDCRYWHGLYSLYMLCWTVNLLPRHDRLLKSFLQVMKLVHVWVQVDRAHLIYYQWNSPIPLIINSTSSLQPSSVWTQPQTVCIYCRLILIECSCKNIMEKTANSSR